MFACKKEESLPEIIDIHNSQTSLDWAGTYVGIVPCADCEGISVRIELLFDKTYELFFRYVGKSDEYYKCSGNFNWNESGNSIILDCESFANKFFVGENRLIMLDTDGNEISGKFAENYVLNKKE
jgi:uncharacterized lipoprotein NlpE involved in copper resistance